MPEEDDRPRSPAEFEPQDDQPRTPEPLELPSGPAKPGVPPSAPPAPAGPTFFKRVPTRVVLDQQKRQVEQSWRQGRENSIAALISSIETERSRPLVVYYSHNSLTEQEVTAFYDLFTDVKQEEALDLFLLSNGGFAGEAYRMATLLREHCRKISILIPYKVKSAATLLSLVGDELIMGPASELGPIDPQFLMKVGETLQLIPALSIKDGLEFLEKRLSENPKMFELYYSIARALNPLQIGSYIREIESSKQYATRLLSLYMMKGNIEQAKKTSHDLTEGYYSHNFAIDRRSARDELHLVVTDATESLWQKMWELHQYYQVMFLENQKLGSIIQAANVSIQLPLVSIF